MNVPDSVREAHGKAVEHLKNSYAPYSNLHVSAALKLKSGELVFGVNVENASYGGTICAERSALVSAHSQYGPFKVEFVVVISDMKGEPIPPCGLCLQFLAEFVDGETPIYLGNQKEILKTFKLNELLPQAFSKEMLLK